MDIIIMFVRLEYRKQSYTKLGKYGQQYSKADP